LCCTLAMTSPAPSLSSQDPFHDFPLTTPTGSPLAFSASNPWVDLRRLFLCPTDNELDLLALLEVNTGTLNVFTSTPQELFWMEKKENEDQWTPKKKTESAVPLLRRKAMKRKSPLRKLVEKGETKKNEIGQEESITEDSAGGTGEHNSLTDVNCIQKKNSPLSFDPDIKSRMKENVQATFPNSSYHGIITPTGTQLESHSALSDEIWDASGARPLNQHTVTDSTLTEEENYGQYNAQLHIQSKSNIRDREERAYHRSQSLSSLEAKDAHLHLRTRKWSGGIKSLDPKSFLLKLKKHTISFGPELKFTELEYRHMYEISHKKLSSRKRPFYQQMLIAQLIFSYLRLVRSVDQDIVNGVVKKLSKSIERGGMVGTDKRRIQVLREEVKVTRVRSKSTGDKLVGDVVLQLSLPSRGRSKSVTAIVEPPGDETDEEDDIPLFQVKSRSVAQAA